MRALSAGELLTVWELGSAQPPPQRTVTLLAAACGEDADAGEVARLTPGQSDGRLLALRERIFGRQLAATSSCPACREVLEFEIDTANIRVASLSEPSNAIDLEDDDYEVRFRLPNQLDIASLDPRTNIESNRQHLLDRCVVAARCAGREISADKLPPEIVAAISDRMAQADPQGNVELALSCPQCGHDWTAPLDVVSFLWTELNAWALRLLRDIHLLASTYGWREGEILSLSPTRRQTYLDLIQG
ncbi:MAG TPA: hypothetical protein VJU77_10670 [Chthoniobacterales bacterium]|nr:hypothetical protein [Chthoniobacterales bacterium]